MAAAAADLVEVFLALREDRVKPGVSTRELDESIEGITNETYGPLKALCEKRAAAAFGAERLTILRPTYICGPGDRSDRFTYWPTRCDAGGEMLWPGTPDDSIQIIDVRDLAEFTIRCAEQRITGTYNTVTPAGEYSMGDLQADCSAVAVAPASATWVKPRRRRRGLCHCRRSRQVLQVAGYVIAFWFQRGRFFDKKEL